MDKYWTKDKGAVVEMSRVGGLTVSVSRYPPINKECGCHCTVNHWTMTMDNGENALFRYWSVHLKV